MSISLDDPGISALTALVGTDRVVVARSSGVLNRITVANFFTDVALTGAPTAPTTATANSSTRIATTAYVKNNLAGYAALASSPTFGNPAGMGSLGLSGAAGNFRAITFFSGANGRAFLGLAASAESGADAGSEFELWTVADSGTPSQVLEASRDPNVPLRSYRPVNITASGTNAVQMGGTQVLTDRQTGWGAPTGTVSRAAFDGSSATLAETREALAALLVDLHTHGMIGA